MPIVTFHIDPTMWALPALVKYDAVYEDLEVSLLCLHWSFDFLVLKNKMKKGK